MKTPIEQAHEEIMHHMMHESIASVKLTQILNLSVEAALKKELSFDVEYELEQFREIERDHFDDDGKAYRHLISVHLCERMLKLINLMEAELKGTPTSPNI
jgi:hypothetical protein